MLILSVFFLTIFTYSYSVLLQQSNGRFREEYEQNDKQCRARQHYQRKNIIITIASKNISYQYAGISRKHEYRAQSATYPVEKEFE